MGCHVSVHGFFDFFLNFYLFFIYFFENFKKYYKFATCQADIVPRGSDSATCHYYAMCHFPILNLVPVF